MNRLYDIFAFNEQKPLIFTQLDFWLFFIAVMILFSFTHKNYLIRSFYLTVVSLFFYFKTSGLYVILLGVSLVVNYFLGKGIYAAPTERRKKWFIVLSVLFNVLTLAYFKYAYFFTDSFNALFQTDFQVVNQLAYWANGVVGEKYFVEKIILPVGVSFFTFQSISYVVDIYRKEIEPVKNFFDYTFFVTFFPQLVAGPIVRARDFIPQIRQPHELDKRDFSDAVLQITKGLIKKIVLADYIAVHFIDKIVDAPESYPGFVSVLAMWGYSLQIYGDFSGYTDIAIGLSRLMGFKLLENFNSPYKAVSVADFWRRWHKSLGSWLRDYLYIPLGGNKGGGVGTYIATLIIFTFLIFITRWYELIYVYLGLTALYLVLYNAVPSFKTYFHRDLNLLITMVVGGLWHGASANFVIWGAMNGSALILYNHWKKISPYEQSNAWIIRFWRIFLTFNFITFTRIWFRLEGDGAPMVMLQHIVQHFNWKWDTFVLVLKTYQIVFWIMLAGYFVHWMPQKWKDDVHVLFAKFPLPVQAIAVSVTVFLMYQAVSDTFKPFVYFQF
jgi:alginate O-acetyltransferase complex protein AlgI